jgi:hypothetical protein
MGLCRTDKSCVGSIAAHPCKEEAVTKLLAGNARWWQDAVAG